MNQTEFKEELLKDLTENILPYWTGRMSDPEGGFFGRRDGHDRLHADAERGAILNARILWTFAAAYRVTGREEYLRAAEQALDYISAHFIDREYGGVYWSVAADGSPLDTKKQFYAIAFTIYGLSEYCRATGDSSARDMAMSLFEDIEAHSRDRAKGGYIEAAMRDWSPIADMRLSDKDENASKTMNTHLHILEAYTALLRVSDAPAVREAHRGLIEIFLDRIEEPQSHHLGLFFNDDWRRLDDNESYGHDIEASWLLLEAAHVHGDKELTERVMRHTLLIAKAALDGREADGSMVYELHRGDAAAREHSESGVWLDTEKHWWVQAEDVVGQLYLWKFHGIDEMLGQAMQSWEYIRENLIDRTDGEWFWSRLPDGSVNRRDDKAGFWKCPYHNSRMHLESLELLGYKQ